MPNNSFNRGKFRKVLDLIISIFPNRSYAFMWHKNGVVSTGKVQCNCEGGSVEHQHIVVMPNWVKLNEVQKRLNKVDFENDIMTSFGNIEPKDHPDYRNYFAGKTFKIKTDRTSVPFTTLLDLRENLIEFPAYCLGIGDGRTFMEKSVIIKSNVKGPAGFLRGILTKLCDDSGQYESNYRKIISSFQNNKKLSEEAKIKLLNDKYLLMKGLNNWKFSNI